ncbi:MAG: hypothetical protein P8P30_05610 [Rickettsiales bacterium]|nr:hypothetical protein [Rickettsiales bacterium]
MIVNYKDDWAKSVGASPTIENGDKKPPKDQDGKKVRHKPGKRSDDGNPRPTPKRPPPKGRPR